VVFTRATLPGTAGEPAPAAEPTAAEIEPEEAGE
jgi:hypothetical protein